MNILFPLLFSLPIFSMEQLASALPRLEQHIEIAVQCNDAVPALWNSITPEERIFIYYLYRASIPGNRIMAGQTHRDAVEITELFERIVRHKDAVRSECASCMDVEQFLKESETFLVYLFTHHGQYFKREFENHKRTPEKLGFVALTEENLIQALAAVGITDAEKRVTRLSASIFKTDYEPTVTVGNSIEKSAGNMYSPDFTEEDFATFDLATRNRINAYFYVEELNGKRTPRVMYHKIGGTYSAELEVAHYWLAKAYEHAQKYPQIFDVYIAKSLKYLLDYIEMGDEEDFKKFSIEWVQTASRIDFNFGFVEVYQDPKQARGSFEADVTIKTVDMQKLNAILPGLEQQLPFPPEFKREHLESGTASMPNASINVKVFASGDAGPMRLMAAYCLPNYADIRASHGSKQIIYQEGKSISQLINPQLARRLFTLTKQADWLDAHDPQNMLGRDIWDLHVLLHETLGHGSGRLATHTFVEGDPLTIGGVTYALGDTLQVTDENIMEFIGAYYSGLEELRAEINALYTSIAGFDVLAEHGLYKNWLSVLSKDELITESIEHMANLGISRLMSQKDDATEIVQAHAQADTAILYYLVDHGGLEIVEETYDVGGTPHTVLGVRVTDLQKACDAVTALACEVQRIKSTADRVGLNHLMKTYGTCVRNPAYIKILKANRQAVQGDLKEVAEIFPRLTPVYDTDGVTITDIAADWPATFLEQQLEQSVLALSKK